VGPRLCRRFHRWRGVRDSDGGAQPDSLVAVSTPIAATAEVHETTNDNGVSKMRPMPAVAVPPGQIVKFAPAASTSC
jgi:copper(I)-binding protein